MSANLVVDIGGSCISFHSVPQPASTGDGGIPVTSGGCISSLSGVLIGDIIDLVNANTYCNVYVAGRTFGSGPLVIGVQCSETTASGDFTDPTSGLAAMPTNFSSGGQLIIASGPGASIGIFGSGASGAYALSGFMACAAFQRTGRYARLFVGSGFYDGPLDAGFISQMRTTGIGGGVSQSPSTSGLAVVNV